jgi:hypothetical protein
MMTVSTSGAGSVTWADRREADRGIGFTTNLPSKKRDRDAGPFKATDSRPMCYGARKAVRSLQVLVTPILKEHRPLVFQLGEGPHASRPISHPTVSKNRLALYGVLLFSIV